MQRYYKMLEFRKSVEYLHYQLTLYRGIEIEFDIDYDEDIITEETSLSDLKERYQQCLNLLKDQYLDIIQDEKDIYYKTEKLFSEIISGLNILETALNNSDSEITEPEKEHFIDIIYRLSENIVENTKNLRLKIYPTEKVG